MSYIHSIATAVPEFAYQQSEIGEFISNYMQADQALRRKLKVLYKRSAIDKRHSVVPDFRSSGKSHHLFNGKQAGITERMGLFQREAPKLALEAASDCLSNCDKTPSHLITVSCTGLSAPGLEIQLMQDLGLKEDTVRLGVNFMGCYAAFHAMKIADAICRANEDANVLIVCVELCSIHFLTNPNEDNLRANALFADGAAALLISGSKRVNQPNWRPVSFYNALMPNGAKDMAWRIGEKAFEMRLTSYIPDLVREGIAPLIEGNLRKLNLKLNAIDEWAIHPGGKSILKAVQEVLELDDPALRHSAYVLKNFGNMSSPTVLFVLKEIWENSSLPSGSHIFSAGFGPGLSLESCLIAVE